MNVIDSVSVALQVERSEKVVLIQLCGIDHVRTSVVSRYQWLNFKCIILYLIVCVCLCLHVFVCLWESGAYCMV